MRILNRADFLKLPKGTMFYDYTPHSFNGGLSMKTGDPSDLLTDDFFRLDTDSLLNVSAHGAGESCSSSDECFDLMDRALKGERVDLHYDAGGRDGMFEADALFAVLDDEDVERLIKLLQERKGAAPPEQCGQCGAVIEGHHACEGVPGGFSDDE